jgi:hypothetical protein
MAETAMLASTASARSGAAQLSQHEPLSYCYARGLLVSGYHWIPANLAEWGATDSILPAVGCNQLRCTRCAMPVRQVGGVVVGDVAAISLQWMYRVPETELRLHLASEPSARLYFCGCSWHVERSTALLEALDDFRPLNLPWACAGHAPAPWPLDLDGLSIATPSLSDGLVADLLSARAVQQTHPAIAQLAGFPAVRVARLLNATQRAAFAAQVAKLLLDPDCAVRRGALGFYRLLPGAVGFAQVLQLRNRRTLWSAPDPVEPGRTLRHSLKLAIDAIERELGASRRVKG